MPRNVAFCSARFCVMRFCVMVTVHTVVILSSLVSVSAAPLCQPGFFISTEEDTTVCRTCAVCPPGHVMVTPCAEDRNTSCRPCRPGHFSPGGNSTECTRCTRCPKGTFVERECTEGADAVCTPCEQGYFSSTSDAEECYPCKQCRPGKRVRRNCTRTSNTKCCGCEKGKFSTDGQVCKECRVCPAGYGQTGRCTRTRDTECEVCPPGHFSPGGDSPCKVCSVCDASQKLIAPCTNFSDTVCYPCPQGFYFDQDDKYSVEFLTSDFPSTPVSGELDLLRPTAPSPLSSGGSSGSERVVALVPGRYKRFASPLSEVQSNLLAWSDVHKRSVPYLDYPRLQCRECSRCPGGTVEKERCTGTQDTVCSQCPSGTFSASDNTCKNCSTCPRGYREKSACTKARDTKCVRCPRGTYASRDQERCMPCSYCPAGKETKRRCTNKRDTVCRECSPGFYSPGYGFSCRQCSLCPPGMRVGRECTPQLDTSCVPCEEGTYTDTWSSRDRCPSCGTCRFPQATLRRCSLFNNVLCGNCHPGYFADRETTLCVKCSYCYPEKLNLTREPGCRGEPIDWQCRPLSHVTNLTGTWMTNLTAVFVDYTTPAYVESPQNVTSSPGQKLQASEQLSTQENIVVILVPVLVAIALISLAVVVVFTVRSQGSRQRRDYLHKRCLSSIPDSSSPLYMTKTEQWLNGVGVTSCNTATSRVTSDLCHSCPEVAISAPNVSGGPESFPESTVSCGVLQKPEYTRRLEQRVSEACFLPHKTPLGDSANDFPGEAVS